ncbi:hypothetical protein [Streptomyces bobili]|uniref:hypothetical protein n=1 Tax=Streptomyces bobili TaxID=67280 RepID=UPI0037AAF36B
MHVRTPTTHLSVHQAQRIMSVVPRDVAYAIRRGFVHARYEDGCGLREHPQCNDHVQGLIDSVNFLGKHIADHPLSQWFQEVVTTLTVLKDSRPCSYMSSTVLASHPFELITDLWRSAPRITELHGQEHTWSQGHPRRRNMLAAAGIPLWVLEQLHTADLRSLQNLTPEELIDRAAISGLDRYGLGHAKLVEQAHAALRLLRVLMVLAVVQHQLLASWLVADTAGPEHPVPEPPVPERPCRPPGALLLASPRVPRAPGGPLPHGHCCSGPLPTAKAA